MEPPFWYYPTRQSLGQALLLASRPGEAEAVYRKDLTAYPRNGWSLFGLAEALSAQDKTEEAAAVRLKFDQVWSMADVELDGSRL
jgi:tetratricopeptide (TPR) repeat protein